MSASEDDPLLKDPGIREAAVRVLDARRAQREAWRKDPKAFRMDCRVVSGGRPYREVFLPWQEEHLFAPFDTGKSLWCEAPRGHDRTDAEGWTVCRDLQYGPPGQRIVIAASDREQARFPIERAERFIAERPDIFPNLQVQKNEVLGPQGSKAIVLSSDVASSLGEKPTTVYMEELAAWPEKGRRLKDSIVGACTKLAAPIRVLTNAGAGRYGNWRWEFREWFRGMAERAPDRYHFWSAPDWVAEWSRAMMIELEGAMTPAEAARFLHNRWLEQDENPAFDADDIRRCIAAYGEPADIVAYVQATDYGLVNDALACGTVGLDRERRFWVLDDVAIAGTRERPASIVAAQEHLLDVMKRRPIQATLLDPYQAAETIQRHGSALTAEEFSFASLKNRRELYAVLYQAVKAGALRFRKGAFRRTHAGGKTYDLEREMVEAIATTSRDGGSETTIGSTMDHPPGGYNDALTVVAMGIWKLTQVSLAPCHVYFGKRPENPWDRGTWLDRAEGYLQRMEERQRAMFRRHGLG